MKNRKIEIRIEKSERITLFRLPQEILSICRICATEIAFIAPEYAAASIGLTMREIFRLVEGRRLHYIETENGATFICINSLENLTADQLSVVCSTEQSNL